MATWDETKAHLRARFKLFRDEAELVMLSWTFEGDPVVQGQSIELRPAFGEPHAVILCDVVARAQMDPAEALAHNMTLAIGALAHDGDRLVLRHVEPLADLPFPRLDRAVELLAHEAARLRRKLTQVYPGYVE
jgi:hypothetical protein